MGTAQQRATPATPTISIRCHECKASSEPRSFLRGNRPAGPAIFCVPDGENWGTFVDDGMLRYLCPCCKAQGGVS